MRGQGRHRASRRSSESRRRFFVITARDYDMAPPDAALHFDVGLEQQLKRASRFD